MARLAILLNSLGVNTLYYGFTVKFPGTMISVEGYAQTCNSEWMYWHKGQAFHNVSVGFVF